MCWVCQTRSSPVIIPTRCKLVQLHHCAPSFPLVRYNATCMLALANRDEEACNLLGQLFACGGVSRVDVANDPDLGGRLWVQGLLSSWQRPVHDQWISFCVCVCVYVCVNSRAKLQHGIRCWRWWCMCVWIPEQNFNMVYAVVADARVYLQCALPTDHSLWCSNVGLYQVSTKTKWQLLVSASFPSNIHLPTTSVPRCILICLKDHAQLK